MFPVGSGRPVGDIGCGQASIFVALGLSCKRSKDADTHSIDAQIADERNEGYNCGR